MNNRKKVCFVSDHNTCRSIIAEVYLRHYGKQYFEAQSFGFQPDRVHFLVQEILVKRGLDPNYSFSKAYEVIENQSFEIIVVMHPDLQKKLPDISYDHEVDNWNFAPLPLKTGDLQALQPAVEELCEKIEEEVKSFIDRKK